MATNRICSGRLHGDGPEIAYLDVTDRGDVPMLEYIEYIFTSWGKMNSENIWMKVSGFGTHARLETARARGRKSR